MAERNPNLWRPAPRLNVPTFENDIVTLHELAMFNARTHGRLGLHGHRFVNCRLEGPAVLLIHQDVAIAGCDLGDSRGDARNLLFKPMGELAVGPIAVSDCVFDGCTFFAVGFTGHESVLERLVGTLPERAQ